MKLKNICLLIIVFLFVHNLSAQTVHNLIRAPKGVITSYWNSQNSGSKTKSLVYSNSDFCPYYLYSETFKITSELKPGKTTVTSYDTEHPVGNEKNSWRHITYKGQFLKEFNPAFVYALPVKDGSIVECSKDENERFNTTLFKTNYRDTVYASRKGIVCETDYSRGILVYHTDGTFAAYLNIDSKFVNPGTKLDVGDPIGTCGFGGVSLSVFFLDENVFENGLPKTYAYKHFSPYFRTDKGDIKLEMGHSYKSLHDDSIITREMSQSEVKRYNRRKKR